jgi:hypothetical protein
MDSREYWLAVQTEQTGLKLPRRRIEYNIPKKVIPSFLSALFIGVLFFLLPGK